MIRRINTLLIIAFIVAAAVFLVTQNSQQVSLQLASGSALDTSLGVLVLLVFGLGMALALLIASAYTMRGYFRERSLARQRDRLNTLVASLSEALDHEAAGEWRKARNILVSTLRREPSFALPRLLLARVLAASGETQEALDILEDARRHHPENVALLMESAVLLERNGNTSAAFDHAALAARRMPAPRTLEHAARYATSLERFEEALNYVDELSRLTPESHEERIATLELQRALRNTSGEDEEALLAFVERYPHFAPGLQTLAARRSASGAHREAAKLFSRAAQLTSDRAVLEEAVEAWLRAEDPEAALSSARAVMAESRDDTEVFGARLVLIRTLLRLQMHEEAAGALEEARRQLPRLSQEERTLRLELGLLAGYHAIQAGRAGEAANTLRGVIAFGKDDSAAPPASSSSGELPSPALSIP